MKKNKVIFTCDNCNKTVEVGGESEHSTTFPYVEGWNYIHNFNMKINNVIKEIKDKHFCSKDCIIKYLTKWIKNA